MRRKRPEAMPEAVWSRICDGVAFNEERQHVYTKRGAVSEMVLDNRKVVDAYLHHKEIVSRKHTQLAAVTIDTAFTYLRELANKYQPGRRIADTPRNREEFTRAGKPDAVGEKISGRLILEVPVQQQPVPEAVLAEASRLGIRIRDSAGSLYKPRRRGAS